MDTKLSFKEKIQVQIKNNNRITFKKLLFITIILTMIFMIISFI